MVRKRYRVTYGGQAQRTFASLPEAAKAAVKAKEKELQRDPHHAGTFDSRDKKYHGDLPGGFIVYTIEEGYVTVYVIEITWAR